MKSKTALCINSVVAATSFVAAVGAVCASSIDETFIVSATFGTGTPPATHVAGSFTINGYDPSVTTINRTLSFPDGGFLNVPNLSAPSYTNFPSQLQIGGAVGGAAFLDSRTSATDFVVAINQAASKSPSVAAFFYTTGSSTPPVRATTASVIGATINVKPRGYVSNTGSFETMVAEFTPIGLSLREAAYALHYNHFNFQQRVFVPLRFEVRSAKNPGVILDTPFLDPGDGGYAFPDSDHPGSYLYELLFPNTFPFYYSSDELTTTHPSIDIGTEFLKVNDNGQTLRLIDTPSGPFAAGEYDLLQTTLVGVTDGGRIDDLYRFVWESNYNKRTDEGGVTFARNAGAGLDGVGTGGVRVVSLNGSVAAVPEPEYYAMLLTGLGVVGFVARRRRLEFE